jgi:arylsulfatase A-like enzyme
MPDPAGPKPKHVLLIHCDQHRYDCLGHHDATRVRTPNLDRLAREGVDYKHAFTPNPICSPARACLQTGAWSTTHGVLSIVGTEVYRPARPDLPVLTQLLADADYRVGHVGKFHGEVSGGPTDHGAETFISAGEYRRWREQTGLPPRPNDGGLLGGIDPHITPEQHTLHWQCDRVLDLLTDYAGTASDRPFFLRWDPPEPHLPNVIPQEMADWYPPQDIAPWPSFADPLENKPAVQRRTRVRWGVDGWTWAQWQPIVSRYLAEIELLDRQVGRLLDALDRHGLADDTLVVFTTDHGDLCGGHGMVDKHFMMYDDVLRVPMTIRLPGVLPAGVVSEDFVSQELDVARTILTVAGVEAPDSFAGRDLIADATGLSTNPRPDMFAQYQGTHQGLYSERMVRDRRWKYVYNPVSFDELYDLDHDPGELRNLVDDPACAGELRRLRERCGAWMKDVNDPLSPPLWTWNIGTHRV